MKTSKGKPLTEYKEPKTMIIIDNIIIKLFIWILKVLNLFYKI